MTTTHGANAALRCAVLVGVGFVLSGCFAEQQSKRAACELQAKAAKLSFTYGSAGPRTFAVGSEAGAYIVDCMLAAGYECSVTADERCGATAQLIMPQIAYCFVPNGRVEYWLYRAEKAFFSI
ncbi:MAG: hypothetical protein NT113_04760 [Hyphomicrobiales bacterium]|nr:hypothetical protein [Hyphomicrobiales bacterium]